MEVKTKGQLVKVDNYTFADKVTGSPIIVKQATVLTDENELLKVSIDSAISMDKLGQMAGKYGQMVFSVEAGFKSKPKVTLTGFLEEKR